jgi:hypothetical protein
MTFPQSGWFANHGKLSNHFSYVICAFTYHMVESDIVLLYIQSHVWSSMQWDPVWWLYRSLRGLPCDVQKWKFLDIAIDKVLGALSMHVVPPAIRTTVVPEGVTILLGLRNPPCSWTNPVGPSLPDFSIAHCVDSLLCYRSIRQPKSIL